MLGRIVLLFNCAIILSTITISVQGTYVYSSNLDLWISQEKVVATWDEASQLCKNEGATLASPINETLFKYMKSVVEVNNHTTPYFIGIKARQNKVQFASEEGILLEDIPLEAQNMLEKIDPRDGDCFSMNGSAILVTPCWYRLPYICYRRNMKINIPPTSDVPVTVPTFISMAGKIPFDGTTECGSGYKFYTPGTCYKAYRSEEKPWKEANSTCAAEGGYLAIINDAAEASTVKNILFSDGDLKKVFWIGLEEVSENNEYKWQTALGQDLDDVFYLWASQGKYYGCAIMMHTGRLIDRQCYVNTPFICEKQLN